MLSFYIITDWLSGSSHSAGIIVQPLVRKALDWLGVYTSWLPSQHEWMQTWHLQAVMYGCPWPAAICRISVYLHAVAVGCWPMTHTPHIVTLSSVKLSYGTAETIAYMNDSTVLAQEPARVCTFTHTHYCTYIPLYLFCFSKCLQQTH